GSRPVPPSNSPESKDIASSDTSKARTFIGGNNFTDDGTNVWRDEAEMNGCDTHENRILSEPSNLPSKKSIRPSSVSVYSVEMTRSPAANCPVIASPVPMNRT